MAGCQAPPTPRLPTAPFAEASEDAIEDKSEGTAPPSFRKRGTSSFAEATEDKSEGAALANRGMPAFFSGSLSHFTFERVKTCTSGFSAWTVWNSLKDPFKRMRYSAR